jgi:hypothetical protein
MSVAVPTRLQKSRNTALTEEKPLQGWRIAVKDNFQIKNIRRSACNRAHYELYPPASQTAPCVQNFCDAGATIVGTTKPASFAATEEPLECIDWSAPFNPRADGYQSPAGSSSGSGVAAAAYDWLDITIGSDNKCPHSLTCMYLLLQRVEAAADLRIGMAVLGYVRLMATCRMKVCSIASQDSMYRHSLVGSLTSAELLRRFGMCRIYRNSCLRKRYCICLMKPE